jgi:hypothetical protein
METFAPKVDNSGDPLGSSFVPRIADQDGNRVCVQEQVVQQIPA